MRKFSYVAPQLEELEALYDGLLCASDGDNSIGEGGDIITPVFDYYESF